MAPYRSDHGARVAVDVPRDQGIVGDIISQFADPLAFYRELVQNSIDAGSSSVEIRLEYDPSAGVLRVAVRDRGEGMTRDILENQLLVLFRSTKERDDTKIGKFGIGFTSVLAPSPEVVVVQTSRDGRRLTLHLHRDLTYQLFDSGPATQTGTSVELDLAMRADEVAEFVRKSTAALSRWCRHASVPLTFSAKLPDGELVEARIDQPLGLVDPLVEVTRRSSDGKTIVCAGLTAASAPYVGFFNHGLMLHETTQPLFGHVSVKIQDGRLGHTLSRDDVRRDASLDRALGFARQVIEKALPDAATVALREAADRDRARWWLLAKAILDAKLEIPESAWWFPLLPERGQARAIAGTGLGKRAWIASEGSAIAAQLIERGDHVLEAKPGDRPFLKVLVANIAGCEVREIEGELTAITPAIRDDQDVALLAIMNRLFAGVHRAPEALFLARLEGLHADVLAVACRGAGAQVIDREQATRNPFGRKRQALAVSSTHPYYAAARALDPRIGASLLVRILLLPHDLLDVPRSTQLLEELLDGLGVQT